MPWLKIWMWPGQFMGLIAKTRSSGVFVRNMFSPNFSRWPDFCHSDRFHDLGRVHLAVTRVVLALAHVADELLEHAPALRVPEHGARRLLLEVEQVEVLADAAVIALLGFLEAMQIGREILVVEPRGAVDALEHLVARIAAPVGAGHLHELEALELAGGRHVRAAAQVEPVALAVEADRLVRRECWR